MDAKEGSCRIQALLDVITAAHFTHFVPSEFDERSGIILVSPPRQMKSECVSQLERFNKAIVVSDLQSQGLEQVREDMCNGRYKTLGFTEMNKLYQRNPAVAANFEGVIAALVAEGWKGIAGRDPRAANDRARCLVVGGMTKAVYQHHITRWESEGGFAQRFLWVTYKMSFDDLTRIGDAIETQKLIDFGSEPWGEPRNGRIPFDLGDTDSEHADRKVIRKMLGKQPGRDGIPFNLLLKIACVLRWHYEQFETTRGRNFHMQVLTEFESLLRHNYSFLTLPKDGESASDWKRNTSAGLFFDASGTAGKLNGADLDVMSNQPGLLSEPAKAAQQRKRG